MAAKNKAEDAAKSAPKPFQAVLLADLDGIGTAGSVISLDPAVVKSKSLEVGKHYRKASKRDLKIAGLAAG
jgi:hypothetical protein